MVIPESTESLTKLLRSKGISTSEICDIYSQLDKMEYYFPNREIFALELINNRWNDPKLSSFKTDYRVWKLYNDMWMRLRDEEMILKKIFKQLKFIPHLIRTLESIDTNLMEFADQLKKTLELINSIITVDISVEIANSVMGKTLDLLRKMGTEEGAPLLRIELIEQVKNLTEIQNISNVNTKVASSFCNVLLLPTIQYVSQYRSSLSDKVIESFLIENLARFLFDSSVDTIRLFENFVKHNKDQMTHDDMLVLYEKSITFLSKQNFTQLEKLFRIIVDVKPELTIQLLQRLSLSKKTMSNEFLDRIFKNTLKETSSNEKEGSEFWTLLSHLLDLDIEIGIQNTDSLLDIIYEHKGDNLDNGREIWKKIVNCHINAREFPQFLEKFEVYCKKSEAKSIFYLGTSAFMKIISQNIPSFSLVQLKALISKHLNSIENHPNDDINFRVLRTIIQGLQTFSYTVLLELKNSLSPVFALDHKAQPGLWEIRYLVMDIFDDIIPADVLNTLDELGTSILKSNRSKEVFFYFFKLREYKDFNLSEVIACFMEFFSKVSYEEKRTVIGTLLTNWSTLMNSNFSKDDLSLLIDFMLSQEDLELLNKALSDDNIFEENNIMSILIRQLSNLHENDKYLSIILRIPLQCINKNIRVELINNICSHEFASEIQMQLLSHLLTNPTFKSDIESDFNSLYAFLEKNLKNLKYDDIVFERVWNNNLSQIKEITSKQFIAQGTKILSKGMDSKKFNETCFQMSFLASKNGKTDICESLRLQFIEKALVRMSQTDMKSPSLPWLLRCLYLIFSFDSKLKPKSASRNQILSKIMEMQREAPSGVDQDLLISSFLLYSILYDDKLEYLFAHYLVIREAGIDAELIIAGIEQIVDRYLEDNYDKFNFAFSNTISSLATCPVGFCAGLLELYNVLIGRVSKDNKIGIHLFAMSISEFYTNIDRFKESKEGVLKVLNNLQLLLTSKTWLFSQYCIELLFPMCLKMNLVFLEFHVDCNDIFSATLKITSNIIFAHRIKLSNRHHLVDAIICEYLALLSRHQEDQLAASSARSLARFIINVCEPNLMGNHSHNKNELSSKVATLKKNLRKYVPVVMVKYIHISTTTPFKTAIRKELTPAIYSIFDLLSQNEMILLNAALDYAGVQYLRSLYADYKRVGKWQAD